MRGKPLRGLPVFVLIMCFCTFPAERLHAGKPPGPFEQVATATIPAAYGELLNVYSETLAKGGSEAIQEISEKLDYYNKAIGRIAGVLDVGGKLYLGQNEEAAISAGLMALGELAGTQTGKAYLSAMGLTTLPVTTLITAIQIYRLSVSELQKSETAVILESFYGTIENDRFLRNRNREIGVGDPIPVTPEAVEYAWRKVYQNSTWRKNFKTYVETELGKDDFPEPDTWSRWMAPGNVNVEAEILQRKDEFKGYIAGLLSSLNRIAKVKEQQFVMGKYVEELAAKARNLSSGDILGKYTRAVKELPKVRAFAKECPANIQQAMNTRDLYPLTQIINNSKRYATDVLAWIPATGRLGTEREDLLEELRSYHDKAWESREIIRESVKRALAMKAQNAKVAAWHARSFNFSLTFDDFKGQIEQEFKQTGGIQALKQQLNDLNNKIYKYYTQQSEVVTQEFESAQQSSPVPPERSRNAYEEFGSQLSAYQGIDLQRLFDLRTEVESYADTLKARSTLAEDEVGIYFREIERISLDFKTSQYGNHVSSGVAGMERMLERYCGDFPSAGYVGIRRLQFPEATYKDGDDVSSFTSHHGNYLSTLGQNIAESRYISFCGGKAYLPRLIEDIDHMAVAVDNFTDKQPDLEILEQKIAELETILEEHSWNPQQRYIKHIVLKLNEETKPFVKKIKDLMQKGKRLKEAGLATVARYNTDLDNIEKDENYIEELRSILGQLRPILHDFISLYPRKHVNGINGYFAIRPEVAKKYAGGNCDAFIGNRVFMTKDDVSRALKELNNDLSAARLLWMDRKFNLGIKDFVLFYVDDRTYLMRNDPPEHYEFIELDRRCRILTKDYFDKLKEALLSVEKIDSRFERNMEKELQKDYLNLLSVPKRDYPVNLVYIDLLSYPKNGTAFLEKVAADCWDDQMRKSILEVVEIFKAKINAFREWDNAEAYFEEKREQLSEMAGNLSSLEYQAQSAYNKDMYDPAVKKLYKEAAAKEGPIMGFLNSAINDAKLSPNRQEYFAKRKEEYERRFFFIRQWADISARIPPKSKESEARGAINAFYDKFKQAYEYQNDAELLSYLSDDWSAGDGTTLYDVEDYFRNMFNVFDDIRVDISGINIEFLGGDKFKVSYDMLIIGRIYAAGITRKEKSSVVEEVIFDGNLVRITRTPQGRFWYVQ
ncbi:MAG: hypothetical protein AVO38_16120 [delta proteobacterium ML8_D]|nr:MAG: hypothetical protein AVO38_16120 [delta proteobacterium ML8_D]